MTDGNTRRRSDKWRDRVLDFLLGAALSALVSAFTIYPRMIAVETRLAAVEAKLNEITVLKVKGNIPQSNQQP